MIEHSSEDAGLGDRWMEILRASYKGNDSLIEGMCVISHQLHAISQQLGTLIMIVKTD